MDNHSTAIISISTLETFPRITQLPLEIMENINQHLNITEYQALRAAAKHFQKLDAVPVLSEAAFNESVCFIASKYIKHNPSGFFNPRFSLNDREKYFVCTKRFKFKRIRPTQECFDFMAQYYLMDHMIFLLKQTNATTLINPSLFESRAFLIACAFGNIQLLELLLQDPRVDPAALHNSGVIMASENGHAGILKVLLQDKRVDPGAWDNRSIRFAAQNGCFEALRLLLDHHGVEPGVRENLPIYLASKNGHVDIVQLLLNDHRVNPADAGNRAIHGACENGNLEMVKILLSHHRVALEISLDYAIRLALRNRHYKVARVLHDHQWVGPGEQSAAT